MTEKKTKRQPAKTTGAARKTSSGFTDEEREAMRQRTKELKAEERMNRDRAAGEKAVLSAIAAMPPSDRAIAEKVHAIVANTAPALSPKTWYGMPAYAKDGKVVCFFQAADKFKARYATLGFNDAANLDDGDMWPTAFALKRLSASEEKKIAALVRKAIR